ncbi:hypothetical protein DXG01_009861 [Tephrocybe rancida]|nr:hypothetical protein DXG01_009861 [Tephrocybe rancida]
MQVLLVQVAIYYQVYKRNEGSYDVFSLAPTNRYGHFPSYDMVECSSIPDPLLTVIISTPIQIFIAYRIKIISRQTWLAGAICCLAIASLGGGVWLTATVVHIRRYARKPELHWPAMLWLLASAIADITITVSLTLNLARRRTGFAGTDDAINRIIRLTIQTGFITAVFATLDVICFLALPHTTINFVWDFALSKLYTNALMSTLNARTAWGKIANGTGHNLLFGDDSPVPQITSGSYEVDITTPAISMSRRGSIIGTKEVAADVESPLPEVHVAPP